MNTALPEVVHPSGANPEPLVLRPDPGLPDSVSDAEAEAAARELGLVFFRPAKVKALEKIGAFAGRHNVVHQGVGRLLAVEETVMHVLDEVAAIAKDRTGSIDEVRVMAAAQVNSLANTLIRSIELTSDFQKAGLIKPKVQKRVFDDSPVQVNNQINVTLPPAADKELT